MSTTVDHSEAAIWERVIHPQGEISPRVAARIVDLDFTNEERQRMHQLAERNRAGQLTPEEQAELDNYTRVGTMLSVLKSRARQVLKAKAAKRSSS